MDFDLETDDFDTEFLFHKFFRRKSVIECQSVFTKKNPHTIDIIYLYLDTY